MDNSVGRHLTAALIMPWKTPGSARDALPVVNVTVTSHAKANKQIFLAATQDEDQRFFRAVWHWPAARTPRSAG